MEKVKLKKIDNGENNMLAWDVIELLDKSLCTKIFRDDILWGADVAKGEIYEYEYLCKFISDEGDVSVGFLDENDLRANLDCYTVIEEKNV